jgi:hypothetical protein
MCTKRDCNIWGTQQNWEDDLVEVMLDELGLRNQRSVDLWMLMTIAAGSACLGPLSNFVEHKSPYIGCRGWWHLPYMLESLFGTSMSHVHIWEGLLWSLLPPLLLSFQTSSLPLRGWVGGLLEAPRWTFTWTVLTHLASLEDTILGMCRHHLSTCPLLGWGTSECFLIYLICL